MRRSTGALAGLVLGAGVFFTAAALDDVRPCKGAWTLNSWTLGDSVRLELKRGSTTILWDQSVDDLRGLTRENLHALRAPVRFVLKRDAGQFEFEGTLTLGMGGGGFQFLPEPSFVAALASLGYGTAAEDDVFTMAVEDISLAYAREAKQAGIGGLRLRDLVEFHEHGVELAFLHDLGAIGYPGLSAEDVLRLHDHGVETAFLRTLKDSGYAEASARDIVRLHDHGVDPSFIRELAATVMARAGFDGMIQLHDHGVDPTYVARIESAGFGTLSVEQIVKLHDHGVD